MNLIIIIEIIIFSDVAIMYWRELRINHFQFHPAFSIYDAIKGVSTRRRQGEGN